MHFYLDPKVKTLFHLSSPGNIRKIRCLSIKRVAGPRVVHAAASGASLTVPRHYRSAIEFKFHLKRVCLVLASPSIKKESKLGKSLHTKLRRCLLLSLDEASDLRTKSL